MIGLINGHNMDAIWKFSYNCMSKILSANRI